MEIREFTLSDYDSVVQLWKAAGLIIRPGDERQGIEIKLQRDPDLFLLAVEKGELVGTVLGAWDGRRGWINHLAVRPDRRRNGIGRTLVSELERRLKRKGARKVNAQIYLWNKESVEFFKAVGYEIHTDLIMIGRMLHDDGGLPS